MKKLGKTESTKENNELKDLVKRLEDMTDNLKHQIKQEIIQEECEDLEERIEKEENNIIIYNVEKTSLIKAG